MQKLQGYLSCVFTNRICSGEQTECFHMLTTCMGTATMCAKTTEHPLRYTAALGCFSGQAFGGGGGLLLNLICGDLAVFPEGNQLVKT